MGGLGEALTVPFPTFFQFLSEPGRDASLGRRRDLSEEGCEEDCGWGGPRLCLGFAPAEVWKLALVSAAQNTEAQVLLKEEKDGPDRLVYRGATVLSGTPYTPPPLAGG